MSRYVEIDVTLDVAGEESDYRVRCYVECEPSRGGWAWDVALDGEPEVLVDDAWRPLDDVVTDPKSLGRVEEWLFDAALEDDR